MNQKDFDNLLILQDYISRYSKNELDKLKKVYTPNDLQKELKKLFTIILQASQLEDKFIESITITVNELESNVKHHAERAQFLKKICDINGLNTNYINYSLKTDL